MSKFFCDSNCELNYKYIDMYNINVIYMPYTVDGEEHIYDMGRTYKAQEFFNNFKEKRAVATQALNQQNYIDYFEPVLASGEDILYVHFSPKLSGTFQYMNQAIDELKEKYPDRKITTVSNLSISIGAGSIVLEAAKMHYLGKSDEEIVKWVEENRQKFLTLFIVDDLIHLKRGGRLSATSAIMGTLLNIKPIIKVDEEGKLINIAKAKGKKPAMLELVKMFKELAEDVTDYPIWILTTNDGSGDDEFLKAKLEEVVGTDAEINIQEIGPTIGCHCGPGTVGVIFHAKHR